MVLDPLATAPGLSPPTRGSRMEVRTGQKGHGSIPAHAGEPSSSFAASTRYTVYPRPRGGADSN